MGIDGAHSANVCLLRVIAMGVNREKRMQAESLEMMGSGLVIFGLLQLVASSSIIKIEVISRHTLRLLTIVLLLMSNLRQAVCLLPGPLGF